MLNDLSGARSWWRYGGWIVIGCVVFVWMEGMQEWLLHMIVRSTGSIKNVYRRQWGTASNAPSADMDQIPQQYWLFQCTVTRCGMICRFGLFNIIVNCYIRFIVNKVLHIIVKHYRYGCREWGETCNYLFRRSEWCCGSPWDINV